MCSTPQKHPAATVAFALPAGADMGPGLVRPREVLVEKGRKRREMKVGIVTAIRIVREAMRMRRLGENVVEVALYKNMVWIEYDRVVSGFV
jgi:hypothetical protein